MIERHRQCGTPMIWRAQKQEEEEMRAKLSPEEFRVWRIRRAAPYHQMSHEAWGTPLPPELDEAYGQSPKL